MVLETLARLSFHGLDVFWDGRDIRLRGALSPEAERLLAELKPHRQELEHLLKREAEAIAGVRCWRCNTPTEFERRAGLCVVVKCKQCGSISMREV